MALSYDDDACSIEANFDRDLFLRDDEEQTFEFVCNLFSNVKHENVHGILYRFLQTPQSKNISPMIKQYLVDILNEYPNECFFWIGMDENSTLGDFASTGFENMILSDYDPFFDQFYYTEDDFIICPDGNVVSYSDFSSSDDYDRYHDLKEYRNFMYNQRKRTSGKDIKRRIQHQIEIYKKGCGLSLIRVGDNAEVCYYGRCPYSELHIKNHRQKFRKSKEQKKKRSKEMRRISRRYEDEF